MDKSISDRRDIARFFWPFDGDSAQRFYADNGFAIFRGVMFPSVCDWANAKFRAAAESDFSPILNYDREDLRIQAVVMRNRMAVEIIEHLTGTEMVGCQTYMLFKEPGTRYAAQAWSPHQDNSYPQAEPGAYLAVAISLCDQDADSGGLFVYPGTHKLGMLPFEPRVSYREKENERPGNLCQVPPGYDKIDITLSKGDVIVFDGDLVHGSYANTSEKPRPMVITNYLKKGAGMIEGATAKRMRIPLR